VPSRRERGSAGCPWRKSSSTLRIWGAASAGAASRTSSWTPSRPQRRWERRSRSCGPARMISSTASIAPRPNTCRRRPGPRKAILTKSPRHKAVLELAADKANWGTPLPAGRARGCAVMFSYGSYVAHVAEVSVAPDGKVRVHKLVGAIDAGFAVNPDQVKAQMEGGGIYALTALLYGAITIDRGRVQQSNFDDYPMLRI